MYVVNVELWPFGDGSQKHSMIKIVGYNNGLNEQGETSYVNYVHEDRVHGTPTDEEIQALQKSHEIHKLKGAVVGVDHARKDGMAILLNKILEKYNGDAKRAQRKD